jgi:hypothetical protein
MSTVGCVNLLAPPSRLLVGCISQTSLFRAILLGRAVPPVSSSKRAEDGQLASIAHPSRTLVRQKCHRYRLMPPAAKTKGLKAPSFSLGPLRPRRAHKLPQLPQPPRYFLAVIRLCSQSILLSVIPHPHRSPHLA